MLRVDATTHYHGLQIHDFLLAVWEDRPLLVSGEDGGAVVDLFTASYLSNRERRRLMRGMETG